MYDVNVIEISLIEGGDKMYSNLNAELARRSISRRALAEKIDMPYSTLLDKFNGRSQFTLREAEAIRVCIDSSLSIDELFFN